jgi:hypothetical protein
MSSIKECDKCNKKVMYTQYQRNNWLCNECFNNNVKEVIESLPKEKNEVIVKYIIPKSLKTLKIKEVVSKRNDIVTWIDIGKWEDKAAIHLNINFWLQMYTANELNKKLNKNLNSIKNEKICIKYWDRYILHSDIIEQFKTNLNIDGNT